MPLLFCLTSSEQTEKLVTSLGAPAVVIGFRYQYLHYLDIF